jgi:O-methyltransferase/aklanonic acid methyltransferase
MQDEAANRKAQTRAAFNRLAPDYDGGGPGCFAHFGRRLVEVVGVAAGQRVLDVACGRGAVLFPAAERVGAAGAVVGIDLADEMVEATRAEAVRRGAAVDLRVMDAEELDFPDASFDRVVCGFGIMFFPRVEQALAQFRRVLTPDGRVGVSTWRVSQAELLSATLDDLGFAGQNAPGWITEPDELTRLLTGAGFGDVRVTADTSTFCFDSVDQYWQNARNTGLRRRIDPLDAEQAQRVRAALAERLRPFERADGIYVEATALLAVAGR